jgi:hypothetical protein
MQRFACFCLDIFLGPEDGGSNLLRNSSELHERRCIAIAWRSNAASLGPQCYEVCPLLQCDCCEYEQNEAWFHG